jgi:hypothetical protein
MPGFLAFGSILTMHFAGPSAYPLPSFNGKKRCTWDIKPTGSYTADCETGHAFAIEFLKSCDGSNGWASLLQSIVLDMISAGTDADGQPKATGPSLTAAQSRGSASRPTSI